MKINPPFPQNIKNQLIECINTVIGNFDNDLELEMYDEIEIIMEVEKEFGVLISYDVVEVMFNNIRTKNKVINQLPQRLYNHIRELNK
jgi:acyl carrier protein